MGRARGLLVALLLGLAGCASTPGTASPEPNEPAKPEPAKPEPAPVTGTPWATARPGDFCVYRMLQPQEMEMRCEVVAADRTQVTWKRSLNGRDRGTEVVELTEEQARFREPASLDALDGPPQARELEVGSRTLPVLVVKRKSPMGSTETWVTRELPPFLPGAGGSATVKSLRDGKLTLELTDFGHAE